MLATNLLVASPLKSRRGTLRALLRTFAALCCLGGALALAACGEATSIGSEQRHATASAQAITAAKQTRNESAVEIAIQMKGFLFSPASVTVPVGTTVRWRNMDDEPHTVVSVDGKFRSGALERDDSFSFRFETPGTYRYVCSIHPQMVGVVVVGG